MSKKIRNYDDDYKGLGDFSDYDYYYGNPGSGKDNRLNNEKYKKGGDRKETRFNTGVMYLLMAVFFGIMIFTVLIGRMYVKNSIASNIDSDQTAYSVGEAGGVILNNSRAEINVDGEKLYIYGYCPGLKEDSSKPVKDWKFQKVRNNDVFDALGECPQDLACISFE